MSDLSVNLHRATTQLPVSAYLDQAQFEREQVAIFQAAPRYLGHRLALSQVGNYQAIAHESNGRALVHTPQGIELLSNICRHRQAVMLQGRGSLLGASATTGGNIVCPLHRWTYAGDGQLIGAPHFAVDPCLNLNRYAAQEWNGLLFEGKSAMRPQAPNVAELFKNLSVAADLDFAGYQYHSSKQHQCDYNWKSFIEVYLEDYHVGPFHPGLGQFVSCEDLAWEFKPEYSVQTVGVQSDLAKPGSAVYERWHQAVLNFTGGQAPKHGAIWLTLYPTVMVEWYPHVLVVSSLHPKGPQSTMNVVEFFYPEEIIAFEPDFIEAQQAAYMETCAEDDEIALRMDAGRKALLERGDNEVGPYQSPMEDGMLHFHEWYRSKIAV